MGKASKATKKFTKNHLKSTIERRKQLARSKKVYGTKNRNSHTKNKLESGTNDNNKNKEDLSKLYSDVTTSNTSHEKDGSEDISVLNVNSKGASLNQVSTQKRRSEKELLAAIAYCQKLSGTNQADALWKNVEKDLKETLDNVDFDARSKILQDLRLEYAEILLTKFNFEKKGYQNLSSALDTILHIKKFSKFPNGLVTQLCNIFVNHSKAREDIQKAVNHICKIGSSLSVAVFQVFYSPLLDFFKSSPSEVNDFDTLEELQLFLIELLSLNSRFYQKIAFAYLSQLDAHLKRCLKESESSDAYKLIYNWQFTLSLRFWLHVISFLWNDYESISKEISPIAINLTLDCIRLIPTEQYYPLRLHLLKSLVHICRSTRLYIPLSSQFLEMIPFVLRRSSPLSDDKEAMYNFDMYSTLHVPKECLLSKSYRNNVRKEVILLMTEYFAIFSNSIAFPELSAPIIAQLRGLVNESAPGKHVLTFLNKLESTFSFVESRRMNVDFTLNDTSQVEAFEKDLDWRSTPMGKLVSDTT